jgi:hypothetical protein
VACQPEPHGHECRRERRLVSRLGIEPRTRRLRVHGWASGGVRRCRFVRDYGRFVSGRVRQFSSRPSVRLSDWLYRFRGGMATAGTKASCTHWCWRWLTVQQLPRHTTPEIWALPWRQQFEYLRCSGSRPSAVRAAALASFEPLCRRPAVSATANQRLTND